MSNVTVNVWTVLLVLTVAGVLGGVLVGVGLLSARAVVWLGDKLSPGPAGG